MGPNDIHNFNAGPAILPKSVFEAAALACTNLNGTGLSILEIGHRTSLFKEILEEARQLAREIMQLGDHQEVLFLHGGASLQFLQVPMNLLDPKDAAAYTDTGVWGAKAIKEARLLGKIDVVCSGKESGYTTIPKDFAVPNDARYLHITTNNTIYGTQWQKIPATSNSLVADMSSDILSRSLPFDTYDVIYAGAQKNIGAAGVSLVVINKNILGKTKRKIPTLLDYRNHISENNLLNTPPVFAVYVCMLMLRWVKAEGGIAEMEKRSHIKANMLYETLDRSEIFTTRVNKADRSRMNVCFGCKDSNHENDFLEFTSKKNIIGIAGHRSTGGFRASLYNALPLQSVIQLTDAIKEFEHNIISG